MILPNPTYSSQEEDSTIPYGVRPSWSTTRTEFRIAEFTQDCRDEKVSWRVEIFVQRLAYIRLPGATYIHTLQSVHDDVM
jgi:hypothetical protein